MRVKAVGFLLSTALCLTLLAACQPGTPEERVAEARARYTASLTGFYAKPVEPEVVEEEVALEGEDPAEVVEEAAEVVEEAAEEAETDEGASELMEEAAGPVLHDLVLDIVLRHDSSERLDGVTLDVSLVDSSQQEKEHWLWWIDTSKLVKGDQAQHTRTLEGVEYVEGDGLHVEVRHPVPAAERGEYREFDVQDS